MNMTAVIYGPGANAVTPLGEVFTEAKMFVVGNPDAVRANLAIYLADEQLVARDLSSTLLRDLNMIMDARLPTTLVEFDAAYPGCEIGDDFLNG